MIEATFILRLDCTLYLKKIRLQDVFVLEPNFTYAV
jgi:hypothetical protein